MGTGCGITRNQDATSGTVRTDPARVTDLLLRVQAVRHRRRGGHGRIPRLIPRLWLLLLAAAAAAAADTAFAADPALVFMESHEVEDLQIHSLYLSPEEHFLYAQLAFGLQVYRRDPASGRLESVHFYDGGSLFGNTDDPYLPRRMHISPDGRQVYMIGSAYTAMDNYKESGPSIYLGVFSVDADSGGLVRQQLMSTPEVHFVDLSIPADGAQVYVMSNFITGPLGGGSGITVFSREPVTGLLGKVGEVGFRDVIGEGRAGYHSPRFSPDGNFLYLTGGSDIDRLDTKNLVVFERDMVTGELQLVQVAWESGGFQPHLQVIDFPVDPEEIYFRDTHSTCAGAVKVAERDPTTGVVDVNSLRFLDSQQPHHHNFDCSSMETAISGDGTLAQVHGGPVSFPYRRQPATGALTPMFRDYSLIATRDGAHVYTRISNATGGNEELHVYGLDSDGDAVIDSTEAALGIDPFNADSDGDGVEDGAEIDAGRNPAVHEPALILLLRSEEE